MIPAVWRDGDGMRDSWFAWFQNNRDRVIEILERLPWEPGEPHGADPIPIVEWLPREVWE